MCQTACVQQALVCMKCETMEADEFANCQNSFTITHMHLKSCESHICLLFGVVFLHFITPSLSQQSSSYKKKRLDSSLCPRVRLNKTDSALLSFLSSYQKKNDESVVRLCFSGLSGSHKPLHVASPAARRKPCVNGFSCNVVIISSRLTLVLITKLFSPLPSSEECCWQQIFGRFTFASVVAAIFFHLLSSLLSAIFCKCNVLLFKIKIDEDERRSTNLAKASSLLAPVAVACFMREEVDCFTWNSSHTRPTSFRTWHFFHPFIVFSSFFQLRLVDIRRRDSIIGNLYHRFCLKGRISQYMSMDIQLLMSCAQESHQLLDMRASVKSIHLCKALS